MHTSRMRGFTLVELLVVVAIIGVLAAILSPVFARAKTEAQKTVCMSDLRQLYTAIVQYAKDYDGALPAMVESWDWDENNSWRGFRDDYEPFFMHNQLGPYLKDIAVCSCPAWKQIVGDVWGPNGYTWATPGYPGGRYDPACVNCPFYDPSAGGGVVRRLETLIEPSKYCLLVCNSPNGHSGFGWRETDNVPGGNQVENMAGMFCHGDGHVGLIRFWGGDRTTGWVPGSDTIGWELWFNGGYPKGEYAFAEGRPQ
jgi:prepilin-type N-terminal cleavage/methylation domain-containing protein